MEPRTISGYDTAAVLWRKLLPDAIISEPQQQLF